MESNQQDKQNKYDFIYHKLILEGVKSGLALDIAKEVIQVYNGIEDLYNDYELSSKMDENSILIDIVITTNNYAYYIVTVNKTIIIETISNNFINALTLKTNSSLTVKRILRISKSRVNGYRLVNIRNITNLTRISFLHREGMITYVIMDTKNNITSTVRIKESDVSTLSRRKKFDMVTHKHRNLLSNRGITDNRVTREDVIIIPLFMSKED